MCLLLEYRVRLDSTDADNVTSTIEARNEPMLGLLNSDGKGRGILAPV